MKLFATLLFTTSMLFAIDPSVTPEWLSENIDKKDLVIVQVSDKTSYELEHIPNAQNSDIGAWRYDNGTFLSIKSKSDIEREISRLGIDKNSEVVLYAPIKEPRDLLKTSYIFWALDYHGISSVALLDGGLDAWKAKNLPLTADVKVNKATNYKATINDSKYADINYVKNALGKLPMVDARPAAMYLGVTPTATVERNGHISGAMSYSWDFSVDKNYNLKSTELLDAVFKDGYNLDKNKEVLVYCTGGLETSYNYYVLKGVLGYKNVRLYDASMKEWGNRADTPMVQYRYENFKN